MSSGGVSCGFFDVCFFLGAVINTKPRGWCIANLSAKGDYIMLSETGEMEWSRASCCTVCAFPRDKAWIG
jgi:hypothetical protein